MNDPFISGQKTKFMNQNILSLSARAAYLSKGVLAASVALVISSVSASATGLVLDTNTLTIAPTGAFDLESNNLIVRSGNGAETQPQTEARLTAYIASGFSAGPLGYWDGPGINSSAALNDPLGITAVGIAFNGNTGYDNWPVLFPKALSGLYTEYLIKYTYTGDTNVDGVLDGSDLSNIDNGFAFALGGWFNGDANYDGIVDGADLSAVDNAFAFQGAPLVSQGAAAAVPEPTSLVMVSLGVMGLAIRRRR